MNKYKRKVKNKLCTYIFIDLVKEAYLLQFKLTFDLKMFKHLKIKWSCFKIILFCY